MAGTYSQIYIHVVFAVSGRQNLISKANKDELQKYITGIVRNKNQKLLAIHCMPDHTHILLGLRPEMALSSIVRDIKNNSSKFINSAGWVIGEFQWQEGYGAFSYSQSQISGVIRYIENQENHHRKSTFMDEYKELLRLFQIEHEDAYIFHID